MGAEIKDSSTENKNVDFIKSFEEFLCRFMDILQLRGIALDELVLDH